LKLSQTERDGDALLADAKLFRSAPIVIGATALFGRGRRGHGSDHRWRRHRGGFDLGPELEGVPCIDRGVLLFGFRNLLRKGIDLQFEFAGLLAAPNLVGQFPDVAIPMAPE